MMSKHRATATAFLASFAIICFFHGDIIGAAKQTHNGFTLNIQNYIPSQDEDSVSVNSPFAVTFSITLENSQGRKIEYLPASINSVQYTYWVEKQAASLGGTTLSAVVPNTYNRNSSLAFTKSSQADIDTSARGDMIFSKAGIYTVHLRVEVSFKNSSGVLTADNSVKVRVDNASILTIYVAQPEKTYQWRGRNVIGYLGGDYGHSFWRVSVAPDAVNIQDAPKNLINTKLGFYPKDGKGMTTVLQPMFEGGVVAGKVCTDDTHLYTQFRDFGISTAKAEEVLNKCDEQMKAQNLRYNFLGKFNADNCTQKCNWVANTIGGVNAPEGKGKVCWKLNQNSIASMTVTIPNPYHHGEQLGH
ncbi:MAG: hypothetical protein LBT89_03285 [Planctomycetaceae bacterium]|jgi:hypothetical protein|nr:hypothetical protein [Planctomycetaceae bacterium]